MQISSLIPVKNNSVSFSRMPVKPVIEKAKQTINTQDNFSRMLNGRRDLYAVKLYNSYVAGNKQVSLFNKIMNCELNIKSAEEFQKVKKNSDTLQRIAREV